MKRFFEWLGIQDAFDRGVIARILIILCLVFIAFGLILLSARVVMAFIPAYPPAHWTDLLLESMILAFGLLTLWLIRKDRMQIATWVILACLLIAVTLQVYFMGDPSTNIAGAMGLQLFAILAILLLDRRYRWVAVGLVISVFIGLNALSTTGYLIPVTSVDPLGNTVFSIFVWFSVSIIITGVLITAMGALRREPELLQQRIDESFLPQENSTTQNNLTYLSTSDALTGLYNRLFFETESSRLEKSRLFPISVIMADIDELKSINDSSGNSAGDQMLIDVAKLFSNVFRGEDVISRYGGDEFAVLLPGADEKISKVIIGRIQDQITAFNKTHINQPMRISIGVSTAQQGESLKHHLKLASKQLARKKKSKN